MSRALSWLGLWLAFSAHAFECPTLRLDALNPKSPRYAQSLLWEITQPANALHKPKSYLFGTMHLSADKTGQPTPAVTAALMQSTQFGMEMVMNLEVMMQIGERMRYADGTNLRSLAPSSSGARPR
jgi:uncharacterized protein YbaP (TraB family)